MRPLKLEFCGINSFSEHTIIDFEKLIKGGLFGIFGDTGSGKSTILDCINFALFGEVERSKEKTDIINYRCDAAKVTFTFDILNEGKRKTYTVTRTLKNDKYGTHKAALYCNDGGGETCIAEKPQTVEKSVEEILGLEPDDFRKCIALPQGEFARFVKSAPRDRLQLIERLFNLSKYGESLKNKISERQARTEAEYGNLAGRLSGYESVTDAALKEESRRLKSANKELKELNKQSAAEAKALENLKKLAEKRAELDRVKSELERLGLEKAGMDELRADLKILPFCRQASDLVKEAERKLGSVQKLECDIAECVKRRIQAENLLRELEKKLLDGNYEEKIAEREKRAAVFAALEGKPEKLTKLSGELEGKRAEYRREDEARLRLSEALAAAEKKVAQAQTALEKSGDKDLETLINVDFKGAILRGEYAERLGYFSEFKAKTERYEDGSPLYSLVKGEIDSQIAEYTRRLGDVKDFKKINVNERIKKLQAEDEERERKLKALERLKREAADLVNEIKLCDNKLATLRKEGESLRAQSDEIRAELGAVFGADCTDFSAAVAENLKILQFLKDEKARFSESAERGRKEINEAGITAERLTAMKKTYEDDLSETEEKISRLVIESGLETKEKCLALAEKFSSFADAEKCLSEYDNKFSALKLRLEELEKTPRIDGATDEELSCAEKRKAETDDRLIKLHGEIAVVEKSVGELTVRLAEKKELNEKFLSVERERNLLYQLKDVLKSNKFLEYIANEYLCDISSLATSTLLKLTDGRYFLTYKDNSFNVGDNFDCGSLRGVNTLSGGETFLVSLSLALALSQTICSKSLRSIEFFFLDEGFGTLDSTLLDTVMNALCKLKSSNFTIGVISHVEELKQRIESKITVIKATESRGSTLQFSI